MAVAETVTTQAGFDRRRKVLESALTVFNRRGYSTSRVEDVCNEAAISRATFYRYFESKEEAFDALIELMCTEVLDSASHLGAVTPDPDGKTTLARWIADLVAITERWGALVDEVNVPRASNPTAREQAVVLTSRFADVLSERFVEGGVKDVDTKMAALAIIAMTERSAHQVRTWDVDIERETMIDSLATLAMKMLHPMAC
ncbi:MAG TPA: TetR/AcrR family transcriptional regulator [Mycobacteriales bacterium]|nr:TetR/AcrR family transcriptional regulator [Mycobacteriales bacterium]